MLRMSQKHCLRTVDRLLKLSGICSAWPCRGSICLVRNFSPHHGLFTHEADACKSKMAADASWTLQSRLSIMRLPAEFRHVCELHLLRVHIVCSIPISDVVGHLPDRESEQGGRSVSRISPENFMMSSLTVGFGAELWAPGCDGPHMVAVLPETS